MCLDKSHLKRHFMRSVLLAVFFIMIFASSSAASASATAERRLQTSGQTAANLGAGGPGSDLRAISSPRQQQTATGFPAGTLPGSNVTRAVGSGNPDPRGRTVMAGDPLPPVIGSEMIGSSLNDLCVMADRVGYAIVRRSYSPTVMDTPYTFALMSGNRRISTLYFNRGMTLVMIE